MKSLPFEVPGDFTPIAFLGSTPMVLCVHPKVPAKDAKEFFALLKSKPGAINYGSSGNGTIIHLAAELVLDAAGVTANHIPYKGVGPMVNDLLGGQVDFAVAALPSFQGHIKAGTIRPIGTLTVARIGSAPEIPTFAEQGLKDFSAEAWFALVGPKGMPAAEVKKINAAVVAAFNDPQFKEAMAKQGNTIAVTTPEEAQAAFRRELAKYAAIVKKVGLTPQ
jgi:tripartite-type tricarboxylate transporter receptor subunit TctC